VLLPCPCDRTNQLTIANPFLLSQTNDLHTTPPLQHRMLTVRRLKMKKHLRRKRLRKIKVHLMQYREMVKARDERVFRVRCQQMVDEAAAFNAESYVRDVLARAARVQHTTTSLTPAVDALTDRPRHWTDVMSVEEMYLVPYTHYIDKRTGYASPEDAVEIEKLRRKYTTVYRNPYFYSKPSDEKK